MKTRCLVQFSNTFEVTNKFGNRENEFVFPLAKYKKNFGQMSFFCNLENI